MCQIIVAKNVVFHEVLKTHSIDKVVNYLETPIFPSAVISEVFVKIFFEDILAGSSTRFQVEDSIGNVLYFTELPQLKNMRDSNMFPGLDTSLIARYAVISEGIYWYKLYIEDDLVVKYPITIKKQG